MGPYNPALKRNRSSQLLSHGLEVYGRNLLAPPTALLKPEVETRWKGRSLR